MATPLSATKGGKALGGLDITSLLALLAASALLALAAWWRFEWRDIRVGGEGSWRLPELSLRHGSKAGQEVRVRS